MKNYLEEKQAYISRVISHSRTAADLMILLEMNRDRLPFDIPEWELVRRGVQHDLDKLNTDYANATVSMYVDELDDNDIEEIKKRKQNCHNHHEINPHHMAYHKLHGTIPSNLDICEMCCDFVASSQKPRFKNQKKTPKEAFIEYVLNNEPELEPLRDNFIKVFDLLKELDSK